MNWMKIDYIIQTKCGPKAKATKMLQVNQVASRLTMLFIYRETHSACGFIRIQIFIACAMMA